MLKITHLTTVHKRHDTRVFVKELKSLHNHNYDVSIIVSDGYGNSALNGIKIFDVGKENSRLKRILFSTKKVLKKAIELDSDIYHFHDPELIPVGLKLLKMNKKVIFDIHENIALQIGDKEYIPNYLKFFLSGIYRLYEKITLHKFTGLILAENSYVDYYKKLNNNYQVILNMPQVDNLSKFINFDRKANHMFYIGSITEQRGFGVTLKVLRILKDKIPDIFLHYIGPYDIKLLDNLDYEEVKDLIKLYGPLPLEEGMKISHDVKVGISILSPIRNYLQSYSTKIFEYMSIGLPVVTSNFPLYVDVVEKYKCGICVNPTDPNEIADAIIFIMNSQETIEKMGKNGKDAVGKYYNWDIEERKLINFYQKIDKLG